MDGQPLCDNSSKVRRWRSGADNTSPFRQVTTGCGLCASTMFAAFAQLPRAVAEMSRDKKEKKRALAAMKSLHSIQKEVMSDWKLKIHLSQLLQGDSLHSLVNILLHTADGHSADTAAAIFEWMAHAHLLLQSEDPWPALGKTVEAFIMSMDRSPDFSITTIKSLRRCLSSALRVMLDTPYIQDVRSRLSSFDCHQLFTWLWSTLFDLCPRCHPSIWTNICRVIYIMGKHDIDGFPGLSAQQLQVAVHWALYHCQRTIERQSFQWDGLLSLARILNVLSKRDNLLEVMARNDLTLSVLMRLITCSNDVTGERSCTISDQVNNSQHPNRRCNNPINHRRQGGSCITRPTAHSPLSCSIRKLPNCSSQRCLIDEMIHKEIVACGIRLLASLCQWNPVNIAKRLEGSGTCFRSLFQGLLQIILQKEYKLQNSSPWDFVTEAGKCLLRDKFSEMREAVIKYKDSPLGVAVLCCVWRCKHLLTSQEVKESLRLLSQIVQVEAVQSFGLQLAANIILDDFLIIKEMPMCQIVEHSRQNIMLSCVEMRQGNEEILVASFRLLNVLLTTCESQPDDLCKTFFRLRPTDDDLVPVVELARTSRSSSLQLKAAVFLYWILQDHQPDWLRSQIVNGPLAALVVAFLRSSNSELHPVAMAILYQLLGKFGTDDLIEFLVERNILKLISSAASKNRLYLQPLASAIIQVFQTQTSNTAHSLKMDRAILSQYEGRFLEKVVEIRINRMTSSTASSKVDFSLTLEDVKTREEICRDCMLSEISLLQNGDGLAPGIRATKRSAAADCIRSPGAEGTEDESEDLFSDILSDEDSSLEFGFKVICRSCLIKEVREQASKADISFSRIMNIALEKQGLFPMMIQRRSLFSRLYRFVRKHLEVELERIHILSSSAGQAYSRYPRKSRGGDRESDILPRADSLALETDHQKCYKGDAAECQAHETSPFKSHLFDGQSSDMAASSYRPNLSVAFPPKDNVKRKPVSLAGGETNRRRGSSRHIEKKYQNPLEEGDDDKGKNSPEDRTPQCAGSKTSPRKTVTALSLSRELVTGQDLNDREECDKETVVSGNPLSAGSNQFSRPRAGSGQVNVQQPIVEMDRLVNNNSSPPLSKMRKDNHPCKRESRDFQFSNRLNLDQGVVGGNLQPYLLVDVSSRHQDQGDLTHQPGEGMSVLIRYPSTTASHSSSCSNSSTHEPAEQVVQTSPDENEMLQSTSKESHFNISSGPSEDNGLLFHEIGEQVATENIQILSKECLEAEGESLAVLTEDAVLEADGDELTSPVVPSSVQYEQLQHAATEDEELLITFKKLESCELTFRERIERSDSDRSLLFRSLFKERKESLESNRQEQFENRKLSLDFLTSQQQCETGKQSQYSVQHERSKEEKLSLDKLYSDKPEHQEEEKLSLAINNLDSYGKRTLSPDSDKYEQYKKRTQLEGSDKNKQTEKDGRPLDSDKQETYEKEKHLLDPDKQAVDADKREQFENRRLSLNSEKHDQYEDGTRSLNTNKHEQCENVTQSLNTNKHEQCENVTQSLNTNKHEQCENVTQSLNTNKYEQCENVTQSLNTNKYEQCENGTQSLDSDNHDQYENRTQSLDSDKHDQYENRTQSLDSDKHDQYENRTQSVDSDKHDQYENGTQSLDSDKHDQYENRTQSVDSDKHDQYENRTQSVDSDKHDQYENRTQSLDSDKHDQYENRTQSVDSDKHDQYENRTQSVDSDKHDQYENRTQAVDSDKHDQYENRTQSVDSDKREQYENRTHSLDSDKHDQYENRPQSVDSDKREQYENGSQSSDVNKHEQCEIWTQSLDWNKHELGAGYLKVIPATRNCEQGKQTYTLNKIHTESAGVNLITTNEIELRYHQMSLKTQGLAVDYPNSAKFFETLKSDYEDFSTICWRKSYSTMSENDISGIRLDPFSAERSPHHLAEPINTEIEHNPLMTICAGVNNRFAAQDGDLAHEVNTLALDLTRFSEQLVRGLDSSDIKPPQRPELHDDDDTTCDPLTFVVEIGDDTLEDIMQAAAEEEEEDNLNQAEADLMRASGLRRSMNQAVPSDSSETNVAEQLAIAFVESCQKSITEYREHNQPFQNKDNTSNVSELHEDACKELEDNNTETVSAKVESPEDSSRPQDHQKIRRKTPEDRLKTKCNPDFNIDIDNCLLTDRQTAGKSQVSLSFTKKLFLVGRDAREALEYDSNKIVRSMLREKSTCLPGTAEKVSCMMAAAGGDLEADSELISSLNKLPFGDFLDTIKGETSSTSYESTAEEGWNESTFSSDDTQTSVTKKPYTSSPVLQ